MKRKQRTGKWRPYIPTDFDRERLVTPPINFSKARTAIELQELQSLAKIRKQRESERRAKKTGKHHAPERRPTPGTPEWDHRWREVVHTRHSRRESANFQSVSTPGC